MIDKVQIKAISNRILRITMEMKEHFPEAYKHLGESPLIDCSSKEEFNSYDFEDYLDTVQSQLNRMKRSQRKSLI